LKTVYRYVLKETLPPFLLSVSVLTLLFMTNKVFLLLDLILNKQAPLSDTLLLYLSLIPFVLSSTIPMSMMMATLLGFGRMGSDMEITAFKSSGVHLFRLILPLLLFSAILTGMLVLFNDRLLPASNYTFKKIHFKILQNRADIAIKEKVFIDLFEGYQFYIDQLAQDGTFANVHMFNRASPNAPVQTTLAKHGLLITNPKSFQVFFQLDDGLMTWDNANYQTYNRLYFNRYVIRLNLENQLSQMSDVKKEYEDLNLGELSQAIQACQDPEMKKQMMMEYQKRLSLPFACLALTWFCAPLGLWVRSKGFIGFVLGLVMIFFYYFLFTIGNLLAQKGVVSLEVGLWGGNILLAAAGFFIYYMVISEQSAFHAALPPIQPPPTPMRKKGIGRR
jgi:lipopolysaccharide export system permease protein